MLRQPRSEHALTWLKGRGFMHHQIDSGEDAAEANLSPILVSDGAFPAIDVTREFELRSAKLPKSLRRFVASKLRNFATRRSSLDSTA